MKSSLLPVYTHAASRSTGKTPQSLSYIDVLSKKPVGDRVIVIGRRDWTRRLRVHGP